MRSWILVIVFVFTARSQDAPPASDSATPHTRAEQIEDQRRQKSKSLKPEEPKKGEKALDRIQNNQIFERLTGEIEGWRIMMGGMVPYSGFSLGPEYYRRLLHERAVFQTTAVGSFKQAYKPFACRRSEAITPFSASMPLL